MCSSAYRFHLFSSLVNILLEHLTKTMNFALKFYPLLRCENSRYAIQHMKINLEINYVQQTFCLGIPNEHKSQNDLNSVVPRSALLSLFLWFVFLSARGPVMTLWTQIFELLAESSSFAPSCSMVLQMLPFKHFSNLSSFLISDTTVETLAISF